MPPRPLRRVLAAVWAVVCVALLPLTTPLGLLARLSHRRRPRALVAAARVYFVREVLVLAAGVWLWLVKADRARHYALLRWFVDGLIDAALTRLEVRVHVSGHFAREALEDHSKPVIVLCRHAGSGDSILMVHLLLCRFRRRVRIVLKQELALEPVIDMVTHRLPNVLIGGDTDEAAAIGELARGLDPNGAMLLFPEGGNFTAERREKAIAWLRRHGHEERADRAERLVYTLSPRTKGVTAALAAAPTTDTIFVAHHGLGPVSFGPGAIRQLPVAHDIHIRMWHAPAAERPTSERAQVEWLDAWWARVDKWVSEHEAHGHSDE